MRVAPSPSTWRILRQTAGWLAVAAMVLLASPGVRVVRAETPVAPEASDGEGLMCKVPQQEPAFGQAKLQAVLEEALGTNDEDTVVLNGRGYNYAPQRSPLREALQIRAEARAQREAAR